MIIWLVGANSFRAKGAIDKFLRLAAKRAFDENQINVIDEDDSFDLPNLSAVGLFASKRIFVLKRVELWPQSRQNAVAAFLKNDSDHLFIIWSQNTKLSDQLISVLAKARDKIEVDELDKTKLRPWIKRTMTEFGVAADQSVIENLITRFGNDLWGLYHEIWVMSLGAGGELSENQADFREYFQSVRQNRLDRLRISIIKDSRHKPFELIVGTVASAIRQISSLDQRRLFTAWLIKIDSQVKKGEIESTDAIALIANMFVAKAA